MKNYSINIGRSHSILKLINEPVRSKKQLDLLLLETIKAFIIGDIDSNNEIGKIVLHINRMNRFIYEVENKIFSINCPFTCVKEENSYIFKDTLFGINIDSQLISSMISIIRNENIDSFEEMIDEIIDMTDNEDPQLIWEIIKKLHDIEYGYIRYDYDEEGQKGSLHPINHLDVNFMDSNQFKIGLDNKINIDKFIDILDITTECYYLSKR